MLGELRTLKWGVRGDWLDAPFLVLNGVSKKKFEDELLKTPSLRVSQVRYSLPSRQVDVPKSSK